jgi:RNA polymerase sigma-70 factor (ECF subfamily)
LETVHAVLYLLFNEGYCASSPEQAIRQDLCEEALRLCHLLCNHRLCQTPTTHALMALMLFHAARFKARLDQSGLLLLLEEQNRRLWDGRLIKMGMEYLHRSAQGNHISSYHLEAGIAMYHCKAGNFAETDWGAIVAQYNILIQIQRSPIYLLNRAIALAQLHGPAAGIQAIAEIQDHPQLRNYHLLEATLGELHRRAGDLRKARQYFQTAWHKTKSSTDRQLLARRLALCE